MTRTTDSAVQGIIDVDTDTYPALTQFIDTANELVTEVCASVLDDDGNVYYSDTRLELIERWLAAHFYAVADPRAAMEKAGPVSQSLQHKVDLNLAVTTYGQQAMLLDTKGGLAALNGQATDGIQRSAGVVWLGTESE